MERDTQYMPWAYVLERSEKTSLIIKSNIAFGKSISSFFIANRSVCHLRLPSRSEVLTVGSDELGEGSP